MTATTTTEAVPFSTEEMREATSELDDRDHARAVATAAALERVTNWILIHELATTCPKLGANEAVMFAPAHRVTPVDFEALTKVEEKISSSGRKAAELREELGLDPVAMARTTDGSPVVAHATAGLEVRGFGAEDLDKRGMPRMKP